MSFFLRFITHAHGVHAPSLPQGATDTASRAAALQAARAEYQFNYTHVSPLAMVDHVPIHDEFSFAWILKVADRVMNGLANLAEIEISKKSRDLHLSRLEKFKIHLSFGEKEARALRELVHESLRFNLKIADTVERPQQIEDYANLFHRISLPPVAKDYDQDPVFAAMRVAGPNPVMIQRLRQSDERFAVTDAHLHTVCPQDSLAAALAEGRLYLADFAALDGVECSSFPHGQKYLYAPLAMFVVDKTSKQFLPVAIQCQQQPAPNNPIFTCRDGYNWLIAKTIVEIADGNIHEAVTHLARTHFLMEPFAVCTFRQLPIHHPIHQLLAPHFQGTLAINSAAWQQLIADHGAVDKLLSGTIQESRRLGAAGIQSVAIDDVPLPKTFAARGVDDVACLPNYPYRDDALLYWNAIRAWVADYVEIYYHSDTDVAGDTELQAWYAELQSRDGGRLQGFTPASMGRRDYLIEIVTTVIYTCSVQHAAVNFPQYDLMSYVPNMPLAGYTPAPQQKSNGSRQDYLNMLPPMDMAALQGNLGYLLGTVRYTTLGEYESDHFADPRVATPLQEFQKRLSEIGNVVTQRNQQRRPYDFLLPSGIPQSINI